MLCDLLGCVPVHLGLSPFLIRIQSRGVRFDDEIMFELTSRVTTQKKHIYFVKHPNKRQFRRPEVTRLCSCQAPKSEPLTQNSRSGSDPFVLGRVSFFVGDQISDIFEVFCSLSKLQMRLLQHTSKSASTVTS